MLLSPRKSEIEFHVYYTYSMGRAVAQFVEALR
jgi:hypothetical protein